MTANGDDTAKPAREAPSRGQGADVHGSDPALAAARQAASDRDDSEGGGKSGSGSAEGRRRAGAASVRPRRRRPASAAAARQPALHGHGLDLDRFRHELAAIIDDVGYLLRNESVVNPELKAQLEQRFERLRGTVSLIVEDARLSGERWRADVEAGVQRQLAASRGAVRDRPFTSVATAALVGLSVGLVLANRR